MSRENNKIRTRVGKAEEDISALKKKQHELEDELNKVKKRTANLERNNIISDLDEKRFIGSDKYKYTYEDIAAKNETTVYEVVKAANEIGHCRRNKNSSAL
jgi:septal ring factor EnvC (AmiA/AmiB activator)